MAHQERFMQETKPGVWVVQCRTCPKRSNRLHGRGKRVFESARECHEWWREHVASDAHRSFAAMPKDRMTGEERTLRDIFG